MGSLQRRVDRQAHPLTVHALHRPAERRVDLQQVRHPADVGGHVRPGGVEQRRVEIHEVAGGKGHLQVVLLEVLGELRAAPRQVTRLVLVAVWQVLGGPALHRHVAVSQRALQRQRRGEAVDVARVALGHLVGHEPEVVVTVRRLGLTTRVHHVDL